MLRRPSEKFLINNPDAASQIIVHTAENLATILGIQFPTNGSDELLECISKACSADCTNKVVTVTVDIPAATCGCIEEWAIKIKKSSRGVYDLKDIRPIERVFVYDVPANTTPTEQEIRDFMISAINADKTLGVVASAGVNPEDLVLTGNDCVDFNAYLVTGMGTVTVTTPFVAAQFTTEEMYKLFPNKHSYWGNIPNVPVAGNAYCKYTLKLKGTTQDLAHSLGYINFQNEIEIYVNQGVPVGQPASTAASAFDAALQAVSAGAAFCV